MARLAPSYNIVTDVINLGDLGDRRPIPTPPMTPWAEGDEPLWESLDLNELPNEVLKMKVCRSFRADLRHKLTLIIRANGGYGSGGVDGACRRLGIKRVAIHRWLNWIAAPEGRNTFERIDSAYEEAVQILVARKMAKTKKCAAS
jgi:hypothetical protein